MTQELMQPCMTRTILVFQTKQFFFDEDKSHFNKQLLMLVLQFDFVRKKYIKVTCANISLHLH